MWLVLPPSLTDPKLRLDSTIVAMGEVSGVATSFPTSGDKFDTDILCHPIRQSTINNLSINRSGNEGLPISQAQATGPRFEAPTSGYPPSLPELAVNSAMQSLSYSKLEVEMTDGHVILHTTIPLGFAIVDNEVFEGKKIIATKSFKKGDLLYVASAALLDLTAVDHKHQVKIYSEDQNGNRVLLEIVSNTDTHSVDDHVVGSLKRQVYGWDAFMNHSCNANAYFPLLSRTESEICYQALALRDIEVGSEVTCDYALFDYHCSGHAISVCACGSKKCRGKMLGFHGLSTQEKVDVLHLCEVEIKDNFIAAENVLVFRSYVPEGIGIAAFDGEKYQIATRIFEPGDIVFSNRVKILSKDELVSSKIYLLQVDGRFFLLDKDHHFVHRIDYVEMLGFDSFMDHSCSPNTFQVYSNKEEYTVYASKSIAVGDKITCDYQALDNTAVGKKNVGTATFKCLCGESNCYGILIC